MKYLRAFLRWLLDASAPPATPPNEQLATNGSRDLENVSYWSHLNKPVILLAILPLFAMGCNGGELVHAHAAPFKPSQFIITTHEPCLETQTHESSSGYAPQPTDGSGQGLVESSVDHGAIESIKLIQEQSNEILDLKSELAELREQNNELTQAMGKLLSELGDLKREAQSQQVASTPAKRSICILSSPACAPCIAWKRAAEQSPETQTVEKRFIDVTQGKPADIDASEWNMVIAKWNSAGGLVPFSWWKDKSGVIRTLVGRYSDSQIEWSMNAADEQVVIPQQQNQQHQQHRPQRNYSSPIAQIFESR